MGARGPRASSALAVVTPIQDHRPSVPEGMPEAQAAVWRAIVNRLPYDWFRAEHLELLKAYVQHCAIAQTLARQVEQFRVEWLEDGGLEHFDRLTKLLEREHKLMALLATKMRLTHQAQYDTAKMARKSRPGPHHGERWTAVS